MNILKADSNVAVGKIQHSVEKKNLQEVRWKMGHSEEQQRSSKAMENVTVGGDQSVSHNTKYMTVWTGTELL